MRCNALVLTLTLALALGLCSSSKLEEARLKHIAELNLNSKAKANGNELHSASAVFAPNAFLNYSDSELASLRGIDVSMLRARHTAGMQKHLGNMATEPKPMPRVALPDSFDWRDSGMVSPVKNQGGCGSCWAFSSIGAIESNLLINGYDLTILSEQQIVDCAPNPDNCGGQGGCLGSIQPLAFEYALGAGLDSDANYEYWGVYEPNSCMDSANGPAVATIDSYGIVPENCDVDTLKSYLVTFGPLAITVATDNWSFYSSGVLSYEQCGSDIDHAVLLVGYGTDRDTDYWTIKNSWGESWGESGYLRISRTDLNATDTSPADGTGCDFGPSEVTVRGTCGIQYANSYVEGAKLASR